MVYVVTPADAPGSGRPIFRIVKLRYRIPPTLRLCARYTQTHAQTRARISRTHRRTRATTQCIFIYLRRRYVCAREDVGGAARRCGLTHSLSLFSRAGRMRRAQYVCGAYTAAPSSSARMRLKLLQAPYGNQHARNIYCSRARAANESSCAPCLRGNLTAMFTDG